MFLHSTLRIYKDAKIWVIWKKTFSFVYVVIEIESACGVLFKKNCKVILVAKKRNENVYDSSLQIALNYVELSILKCFT